MTEKILLDEIKSNRSPSVLYMLFDADKMLRSFSFGLADIETGLKADPGITYNVYSITKTFTALAIFQLVQDNRLHLDDQILRYLPDLPYNPGITIKHLLTHTSGIPNPIPLSWIHLSTEKDSFDRDQFFQAIISRYSKTGSVPNEKFSYSNLGYVILGLIIEKVSGIKYEEYIQNNIIKVLGLRNTEMGFEIIDPCNHATGYHPGITFSNLVLGFFIDKTKYMGKPVGNWKPFRSVYVNGSPYGGLIANPASLVKYIQALLKPDCRLITDDLKNLLFKENHTADNKATGMCFSWFKGRVSGVDYFTHAGGGGGYYCEIRIYPDRGLGSTVFFNRTGMSDRRFLDRLDREYLST